MGVLLMPRAAVASPFPLQTSGWYFRRKTQLPGRGRALLALRADFGAAGPSAIWEWAPMLNRSRPPGMRDDTGVAHPVPVAKYLSGTR